MQYYFPATKKEEGGAVRDRKSYKSRNLQNDKCGVGTILFVVINVGVVKGDDSIKLTTGMYYYIITN